MIQIRKTFGGVDGGGGGGVCCLGKWGIVVSKFFDKKNSNFFFGGGGGRGEVFLYKLTRNPNLTKTSFFGGVGGGVNGGGG